MRVGSLCLSFGAALSLACLVPQAAVSQAPDCRALGTWASSEGFATSYMAAKQAYEQHRPRDALNLAAKAERLAQIYLERSAVIGLKAGAYAMLRDDAGLLAETEKQLALECQGPEAIAANTETVRRLRLKLGLPPR